MYIIYEKWFAAMTFSDSSTGPVVLVAVTEVTKCSHSSSFIFMWQCVTPQNDTGSYEYQEPMGELCSQELAAEFAIGSLIFIQVAMPLKIWVVRGYQYNIVVPVMATRVTFPIVNFKEYISGTCIESLIISWLFHNQCDQIIRDIHYKMFSDQHIFCFRFDPVGSSSNNDAIVAFEKAKILKCEVLGQLQEP